MSAAGSVPLEDFIEAVQVQLDTAQARMTLKARNDRLPLTFAIKDISLDLRAHVEVQRGEVRIRPASAADGEASVFHLVFTAITRPMIDENSVQLSADTPDDPGLDTLETLDDDERQRLERVGVRTVSQLNDLERRGISGSVGRITNLPADRLRSALARAARPMVDDVSATPGPVSGEGPGAVLNRVRVRGRNLLKNGAPPTVTIGGERVAVVQATDRELVLAPQAHQLAGAMSLAHDVADPAHVYFDAQLTSTPANGHANETPGAGAVV